MTCEIVQTVEDINSLHSYVLTHSYYKSIMALQKLGAVYNLPKTSSNPYSNNMASKPQTGTVVEKHVDVDAMLEDYAWKIFKDMVGIKKAGLDQFRGLDREEVEFVLVSYISFSGSNILLIFISFKPSLMSIGSLLPHFSARCVRFHRLFLRVWY